MPTKRAQRPTVAPEGRRSAPLRRVCRPPGVHSDTAMMLSPRLARAHVTGRSAGGGRRDNRLSPVRRARRRSGIQRKQSEWNRESQSKGGRACTIHRRRRGRRAPQAKANETQTPHRWLSSAPPAGGHSTGEGNTRDTKNHAMHTTHSTEATSATAGDDQSNADEQRQAGGRATAALVATGRDRSAQRSADERTQNDTAKSKSNERRTRRSSEERARRRRRRQQTMATPAHQRNVRWPSARPR